MQYMNCQVCGAAAAAAVGEPRPEELEVFTRVRNNGPILRNDLWIAVLQSAWSRSGCIWLQWRRMNAVISHQWAG